MSDRLIVVGGDAAGMSAAARGRSGVKLVAERDTGRLLGGPLPDAAVLRVYDPLLVAARQTAKAVHEGGG